MAIEVHSLQSVTSPRVTVVMAVRNEGSFIARSLGAVLAQDYPCDRLEVIVADGMSTDDTRWVVQSLIAGSSNARLIDNPNQIVSSGLNAAINHAQGEIIVRVDGHTIVAPDYVRECVDALGRSGADNVGGRMDAASNSWLGKTIALATSSPFGVGGARFHYSQCEQWVDTVYLGAWPRQVFERIGLFDEEQVRNQDDELNYRLRSAGGRVLLCPRIRSTYYNRDSIRLLCRQYFQYGYWKVRVLQKHPLEMQGRQFVPPLFVLCLLGGALLASHSSIVLGLWLLMCTVYGLANLLASLSSSKNDWKCLPLLPMVFFSLHFSYGLGFLVGLVRFAKLWFKKTPHRATLSSRMAADAEARAA